MHSNIEIIFSYVFKNIQNNSINSRTFVGTKIQYSNPSTIEEHLGIRMSTVKKHQTIDQPTSVFRGSVPEWSNGTEQATVNAPCQIAMERASLVLDPRHVGPCTRARLKVTRYVVWIRKSTSYS